MGLLIDGIIGPVLEAFGVIEVGENGEWARKNHDTTRKEYQKKEREDKESLWERFVKWLQGIVSRIKAEIKRNRTPEERYRAAVRKDPEELNKSISEVVNDLIKENEATFTKPISYERRTRNVSKEKLRKISKFEGKTLASSDGYRLWYGDHFPYDNEVEEGVVYVVKGQGDPIAYTGPLAGIRQDAYYVWDKTKEIFEPIGTTPPKETIIDKDTGEFTIRSRDDDTRWYYTGAAMYDPAKNYVIYPNTVDDYDDETPDGMRPWGIL